MTKLEIVIMRLKSNLAHADAEGPNGEYDYDKYLRRCQMSDSEALDRAASLSDSELLSFRLIGHQALDMLRELSPPLSLTDWSAKPWRFH